MSACLIGSFFFTSASFFDLTSEINSHGIKNEELTIE